MPLLGVAALAVVEGVLDVWPDLHHRAEFWLLELMRDVFSKSVQHRLLDEPILLHW